MRNLPYLLCSSSTGIVFFGVMFTLIRTFYYKEFPCLQEYIFPFVLGTSFGTGIGLWRIQTNTFRKQLEKTASELSVANTELKVKNEALVEAQDRLRQSEKMEAMGILAGGVAHDLNNILSSVIVYPEIMLQDVPEGSRLRTQLQQIKESGEKAAAIIQDLLTLARRRVQRSETVDIKSVAQQYLSSPEYKRLLSFHPGVVVETVFDTSPGTVRGSWIHLYKMIMNLVSNAAEAMPDGGVIRIAVESRHIDPPIGGDGKTVEGGHTVLSVTDTGLGIEKEDLDRIFEPFFTKKKMGRSGTGLGMAVVWWTVMDHNGHIEVCSRPGEGSQFRIYLPTTGALTEQTDRPSPGEIAKGRGQRVLVVDDVKEQREMAAEILRTLDYQPVSVNSGESAIEYLKNNHADVMLIDIIMDPGINGTETYQNVLRSNPDMKAIFMSGFSQPETGPAPENSNPPEFLQKPYRIESLANALHRVMGD